MSELDTLKSAPSVNDKLIESLKLIEGLSKILGIKERDRITFDIDDSEAESGEIKIRIKNGEVNYKTPWFSIKNEEPFIFIVLMFRRGWVCFMLSIMVSLRLSLFR